jgi:hypothetical protein
MELKEHEPGTTPQRHVAFRDTGRRPLIISVAHLSLYGLTVDYRNNRLLDAVTSLSTPGLIEPLSVPSVKDIARDTEPDKLL